MNAADRGKLIVEMLTEYGELDSVRLRHLVGEENIVKFWNAAHDLEDRGFISIRKGELVPERGNRPRLYLSILT